MRRATQARPAPYRHKLTAAQHAELVDWCATASATAERDLRAACISAIALFAGRDVIRCAPCIDRLVAAGEGAALMAKHPSVARMHVTTLPEHVRNRSGRPHVFDVNPAAVQVLV